MAKRIDIDDALQGLMEEEAIRLLRAEARKLKYIALKVWRRYLASYQPKAYAKHINGVAGKRTRDTQRGIKIGEVFKVDGNHLGIEITYENDLMYHDSVFGSKHSQGHSVMLISNGWRVKKGRHKNVYRFGYYEGFDYIGQVEKAYNAVRNPNVSLEVNWTGNKNYTR